MAVGRYPRQLSAHTELVTLRILQDDESTGFISYHPDLSGSKTHQPRHLDRTSIRPGAQRSDVEVDAVLDRLVLGQGFRF